MHAHERELEGGSALSESSDGEGFRDICVDGTDKDLIWPHLQHTFKPLINLSKAFRRVHSQTKHTPAYSEAHTSTRVDKHAHTHMNDGVLMMVCTHRDEADGKHG